VTEAVPRFELTSFPFEGRDHRVYRGGKEGPAVVVLHETPGLHPMVIAFAQRLVDEGYRVYMPSLFGRDGARVDLSAWARLVPQLLCMRREFEILGNRTSGAVTWLRKLAELANDECNGQGVGVVGMCFTGGFALAMAVDDFVVAPVLSQPSLPWAIGRSRKSQIGLSPDDLTTVRNRARDGLKVLGLRFTNDRLCPRERFATYTRELGPAFREFQITSPDPAWNIRNKAHSVLASDFVDVDGHPTRLALKAVLDFLDERLRG
jgi:dienelactone hydrolase